jgi:hypothetical protein
VSLPVFLAGWGLLVLLVAGETTATTWALGLASMFPVSALLVAATGARTLPRTGRQHAVGLVASVAVVSTAYLGVAFADRSVIGVLRGLGPVELVAVGVTFALIAGAVALVDARYVERPITAPVLEERYLDESV